MVGKMQTIIPIPKPGKDPAEPNNYRPIALTSCLCKALERMINKRLTWFLESDKANSTNLYPPTKVYLRCKSQNINPIYLTLSSPTVSFRS